MFRIVSSAALMLMGCSGNAVTAPSASNDAGASGGDSTNAAALDAAASSDGADASVAAPRDCPPSGKGGIAPANGSCVVFTPIATGAAPDGQNADVDEYALAPAANASNRLVVFLNGSGGSPAGVIGDPRRNVYNASSISGHHVLGLSYRSDDAVGALCGKDADRDGCFLPTRETIITGVYRAGAADALKTIRPSEAIYARLVLALRFLARQRPTEGWDRYLDPTVDALAHPGEAIRWRDVIVSGHSQGGGHAAAIAKLHAVARMVALSSPCDAISGTPATWLRYDAATWKTDMRQVGVGFAASTVFSDAGVPIGGDTVCDAHAAVWSVLQLDASRRHDDAITCDANGHSATIKCPENFDELRALYAP